MYTILFILFFLFVSGVGVVMDTIRRIVAARALKNLMTVYTVNMVITHRVVRYIHYRLTLCFSDSDWLFQTLIPNHPYLTLSPKNNPHYFFSLVEIDF